MSPTESAQNIIIRAQDAEKLIRSGNGRACLYYLCAATGNASVPAVARSLGWSQEEAFAARTALEALGLFAPQSDEPPESDVLPAYTPQEINTIIDGDPCFKSLIDYTKLRLNKLLTPTDMRSLLGLYSYLGMSAGVLMLLISYTVERCKKRNGEGARVGMKDIEREGFYWHRKGIVSEPTAEDYIRRRSDEDLQILDLARLLNIRDRAPTSTEEKYLRKWADFAMDKDVVYSAYDKTVVNTGSLKWGYMNSILEDWHTKGIRKSGDIGEKDRPAAQRGDSYSSHRDSVPEGGKGEENAAERLRRMRSLRDGKHKAGE